MTITEIRNLFEKSYEQTTWKTFLQTYFQNMELFLTPQEIDLQPNKLSEKCFALGNYKIDKYLKIGFFEIHLNEKVKLTRNRLGLRILLKNITMQMAGVMVVFVQGDKWRFSYISKRKMINKETNLIEEKETAAKRYTYLFGKNEKALTAATRFQKLKEKQEAGLFQSLTLNDFEEAFSVEKLSKDFFFEYKNHYNKFVAYITQNFKGKSFFLVNDEDKAIRDFCKKLLGRIVFLYFVQKKGWLGASDLSYKDGKLNFITDLFYASGGNELFYPQWLTSLFFDTLNNPDRKTDNFTMPDNSVVKIPFLNGGLFDKEKQDDNSFLLTIEPSLFHSPKFSEIPEKRGFLDFLNAYNFTVQEDAPDEHTVAVDPEMLGNIFENLLEDNKDKGAFYTPKEIVHFMCKESIKEYLLNGELSKENTDILEECIQKILEQSELTDAQLDFIVENAYKITDILENVKVCDPAIGSGAFPMGLLQEIFNAVIYLHELKGFVRNVSEAQIKKTIIEKCIYGVDIEKGAVDIARLRFWLSLVVDEEMPQALPNLDYKIVVGNSLTSYLSISKERLDIAILIFLLSVAVNEDKPQILPYIKTPLIAFGNGLISELNVKNLAEIIRVNRDETLNEKISDEFSMNIKNNLKKLSKMQAIYFSARKRKRKEDIFQEISRLKLEVLKYQFEYIKELLKESNEGPLMGFDSILQNEELNIFDWRIDFASVLGFEPTKRRPQNGFDIVIGSPPYRVRYIKEPLSKENYMYPNETLDCFVELAFNQLVKQNGIVAYITPDSFLYKTEYKNTRELVINQNQLLTAINLGDGIFPSATIPAGIFIAKRTKKIDYQTFKFADLRYFKSPKIEIDNYLKVQDIAQVREMPSLVFGILGEDFEILKEIERKSYTMEEIVADIKMGISTGDNSIFYVEEDKINELELEDDLLYPFLTSRDINKYNISKPTRKLLYVNGNFNESEYPKTYAYLLKHQDVLKKRESKTWYSLKRAQNPTLFTEPKILIRRISDNIRATFDEKGYFVVDSVYVYKVKEEYKEIFDYKFVLAMLNSKVNQFVYRKFVQEGSSFPMVKAVNILKLFVPKISKEAQQPFIALVDYMLWLNEHEKPNASRYIENNRMASTFESTLDICIYELYFAEEMKEKEIDVLQFAQFESISGLTDNQKIAEIIGKAYSSLQERNNPIRNRIILTGLYSKTINRINSNI